MKSCFRCRETANCLIIQVFTLMKHYSMGLEHGVQPNYHPSAHAVKSDYSLASQWVVPTSFLFSNHQMRKTAVLHPLSLSPPTHHYHHFKNMKVWICCIWGKGNGRERWVFHRSCFTRLMWCMVWGTGSPVWVISCRNLPLLTTKCFVSSSSLAFFKLALSC